MRILIIEDDGNKRAHLASFLRTYGVSEVDEARSYHSGLRAIDALRPEIILLDMTMPTYDIDITRGEDGGRRRPFAGREVLQNMRWKGIDTPVIVVTQFDRFGSGEDTVTLAQLDAELATDHAPTYRGSVYYDASLSGWKRDLHHALDTVCASFLTDR